MNTLADLSAVRKRGALLSPPSAGGINNNQVEAALLLGQSKVRKVVGDDVYRMVLNWDDDDLADTTVQANGHTKAEQRDDFLSAECYFAVSKIGQAVNIGKVTETGTPQTMQVGREVKTFAPLEEDAKREEKWELEAYRCLAPYLATVNQNEDGAPEYFANATRRMVIIAVGGNG